MTGTAAPAPRPRLTPVQRTALQNMTMPGGIGSLHTGRRASIFACTERTAQALADAGLVTAKWMEVPHHNGRRGDMRWAITRVEITAAGRAAVAEEA